MRAATTAGNRWRIYQRERFPLLTQGPVIAAFSFSAVSFSALLRHRPGPPPAGAVLVAFVTSFVFFPQLRIADEFKDADDDARYRPYRPVPRGLVRLPELAAVAIVGTFLQLLLALWLDRRLVGLLVVVWLYLGLLSREFFMGDWLRAHPFTYMWTHLLIIPLIDLYASACDWLVTAAPFRTGSTGSSPPATATAWSWRSVERFERRKMKSAGWRRTPPFGGAALLNFSRIVRTSPTGVCGIGRRHADHEPPHDGAFWEVERRHVTRELCFRLQNAERCEHQI